MTMPLDKTSKFQEDPATLVEHVQRSRIISPRNVLFTAVLLTILSLFQESVHRVNEGSKIFDVVGRNWGECLNGKAVEELFLFVYNVTSDILADVDLLDLSLRQKVLVQRLVNMPRSPTWQVPPETWKQPRCFFLSYKSSWEYRYLILNPSTPLGPFILEMRLSPSQYSVPLLRG